MIECEWCGGPKRPAQVTCSSRCRGGRHRWLNDVKRAGGADPKPPPWTGSPLHGRMGDEARSNTPPVSASVAELRRVQQERNRAVDRAARALARAEAAEAVAHRRDGSRTGHRARSGVMLSYAKTREALVAALWRFPGAEQIIDDTLRDALAPAQRAKLEAHRADR